MLVDIAKDLKLRHKTYNTAFYVPNANGINYSGFADIRLINTDYTEYFLLRPDAALQKSYF